MELVMKFSPKKKTMTLNMTEKEMAYLTKVSSKKGMTKTQIMRQALRIYQLHDEGALEMRKGLFIGIGDIK